MLCCILLCCIERRLLLLQISDFRDRSLMGCLKCMQYKCDVTLPWWQNFWIGSLSNDASDGKEKWKKAIGLYQQNNNCARASRCFVRLLAVVARLRRETSRFHAPALRSRRAQRKNCLFLFRNLDTVFSDLTPENFANI